VSTAEQNTERQEIELAEVASHRGWTVVEVYRDEGISGSKGRDERPAFDRMHRDMARCRFDVVMAHSVDRLGRSPRDLVEFMEEVRARGLDLFLHQQALDTSTPAGRMMFQLLACFSEFEKSLIIARVRSGLERARRRGVRLGRPPVDPRSVSRIQRGLQNGERPEEIAERIGLSVRTVNRVRRRLGFPSMRRPVETMMPEA
jgi:DNA invertase Pin-like site-specific DNA recombinase